MWDANPHGAGFMYADSGKVVISKGYTTLDALWDALEAVGPLRKLVIHFRIKTHGAITPELTHPFWVSEGHLAMAHNGVIQALVNETSDLESDTAVFARKFGEAYSNPLDAIKNPFHRDMLEAYIGYSKMVFMDGTGATYILNEKLGTWHKGCWYSNDRFKSFKSSTATNSTSTGSTTGSYRLPYSWRGKFEDGDQEVDWKELYKGCDKDAPDPASETGTGNVKTRGSENSARLLTSGKTTDKSPETPTQKPLIGMSSHWNRLPDNSHLEARRRLAELKKKAAGNG
jgi:hypothetical protein